MSSTPLAALEVDSIPERNRGDDQVEAARSVALVLERAISDFAKPIEEHGACERVSGLSLVEPGLHIHPTHAAASRHAAMGMLFVLRSLGNHHLGRQQQARDGCGVLQRKPRDLRWIKNALFEHVAELTGRRVIAVGTLAGFHLVQDDRRILAGILNDISQGLFDRSSENTDADGLILIGTL